MNPTAIVPAYGLAECSLLVTYNTDHKPLYLNIDKESLTTPVLKINEDPDQAVSIVNCGRPIDDHHVVVWNFKENRLCHDLEIGEILIAGDSVTNGYTNTLLNESLFHPHITEEPGRRLKPVI